MPPQPPSTTASDAEVLDSAAEAISTPRVDEGDSFVLHAPLEVLARSALLGAAGPEARWRIRRLIGEVAETYQAWGSPVQREVRPVAIDRVAVHHQLGEAIATGDLDTVDDIVAALAAGVDTDELVVALAPVVLPSLAAAAHGPILLHLLPRTAPRSLAAAAMARTTLRELARHPTWTLAWLEEIHVGRTPPVCLQWRTPSGTRHATRRPTQRPSARTQTRQQIHLLGCRRLAFHQHGRDEGEGEEGEGGWCLPSRCRRWRGRWFRTLLPSSASRGREAGG